MPFLSALFARATSALCDGPISWLLARTSSRRSAPFPGNSNGVAVHAERDIPSFRTVLPSSLAYSLLAFVLGLLFVLIYLLV